MTVVTLSVFKSSFLLIFVLIPTIAIARSPAPKSCPRSTIVTVVKKAKKVFPGYPLKARGICQFFGTSRQVPFHPFTIKATSKIQFYLNYPMGIISQKDFGDLRSGPKIKPVFHFAPIGSSKQARTAAKYISKNSVIRKAFGKKKLYCSLSSDAPGSTTYIHCSTKNTNISGIATNIEKYAPIVVFQMPLNHPGYSSRGKGPRVYKYAFTLPKLHLNAPRFSQAKKNKRVAEFLAEEKDITISLNNWHLDYLTLTPKDSPKKALLVVFGRDLGESTSPIVNICRVTTRHKCIMEAKKKSRRNRLNRFRR